MSKYHWRFFLLRWHRRLGVLAALFVLLLAVTGLALNHSQGLRLDQQRLNPMLARLAYGWAEADTAMGLPLGERWLLAQGGQLFWADRDGPPAPTALGGCESLLAAVPQAGLWAVLCADRLLLLTAQGELLDQLDTLRGLPPAPQALGLLGDVLLLRHAGGLLALNIDDLSLRPQASVAAVRWAPGPRPQPLAASVPAELHWERLLLDLHSGRLLGSWGPWLMDAAALLFIALACSGLYLARRRRHR